MCFACFNLGDNSFYLDKMIVTASDGTRSEGDLTPQVVTPGTWVMVDYNPSELLGLFGESIPYKEANCVFVLRGASGTVTTDPVWFYVGYGNDCADWDKGRLAERLPGTIPSRPKVLRIPKQKPEAIGPCRREPSCGNTLPRPLLRTLSCRVGCVKDRNVRHHELLAELCPAALLSFEERED